MCVTASQPNTTRQQYTPIIIRKASVYTVTNNDCWHFKSSEFVWD